MKPIEFHKGDFYKKGENIPLFENDGETEFYYHQLNWINKVIFTIDDYLSGFVVTTEENNKDIESALSSLLIVKNRLGRHRLQNTRYFIRDVE